MGFPIGWTDIDCDEPEPWPGWPAGMGAKQFDYEPPRTCGKIPNRAKRLKCLGNAVVPQQAAPIFRAIAEMDSAIRGMNE
jgi:DNA (cytosine-5)-methyltransferase 1